MDYVMDLESFTVVKPHINTRVNGKMESWMARLVKRLQRLLGDLLRAFVVL
jgi:hypothetical protein